MLVGDDLASNKRSGDYAVEPTHLAIGRLMKLAGVASEFVRSEVVDQEDNDIRPTRLLGQDVAAKAAIATNRAAQANSICVSHGKVVESGGDAFVFDRIRTPRYMEQGPGDFWLQ